MENVPQAPAGWHPDPSGVPQLRYWDGQVWTHHVAPLPGAEAPAAAAAQPASPSVAEGAAAVLPPQPAPGEPAPGSHPGAPGQYAPGAPGQYAPAPGQYAPAAGQYAPGQYAPGSYPVAPQGPREKAMTGGTWAVLAATVVVVGGAIGALGWGAASASEQIASEAPAVIDGFLGAASTGDASWTDFATPGLATTSSAPLLYGDAAAAESIGLEIDYTVGELLYGTSGFADFTDPTGADMARVPVELTYTFLVDGAEQTAKTTQAVWLSRAYYYGDDQPSEVREDETPTAVGPWRIAGLSRPSINSGEDDLTGSLETSYAAPDDEHCPSARSVLVQLSEGARVNGFLPAVCLSDGTTTNVGEGINTDELADSFPVITDMSPLQEVVGLSESYDEPSPLEEYRVAVGNEEYVFVFAAVGEDGERNGESGVRLISLQKVGAQ